MSSVPRTALSESRNDEGHTPPGSVVTDHDSHTYINSGPLVPRLGSYFSLVGLALAAAALSSAALAWDGAVYLFQLLDEQAPFTPNGRLVNVIWQLPTLAASYVTDDLATLRILFSVTYAAIPLLALAFSWWIVRSNRPGLFIWPALGIGIATLPGQFMFVSEANAALQFAWPILLAMLARASGPTLVWAGVAAAIVLFSHPFGIVLFAAGAAMALFSARLPVWRRQALRWAAALTDLAILAALSLWLSGSTYEQEQLTPFILGWTFNVAVLGLPLASVACGWLAGAVLVASRRFGSHLQGWWKGVVDGLACGLIVVAGALLLWWALDPRQWHFANKYPYWGLFITFGFMLLAVLDASASQRVSALAHAAHWRSRSRAAHASAFVLLAVLLVQSASWLGLGNQVRHTLAASPWSCLSMAPQEALRGTALDQFATPYYSVLLQGRTPAKVFLGEDACGTATFNDGVTLDGQSLRAWNSGWFDFGTLRANLLSDVSGGANRNGCAFILSTGWHQSETDGPYWWRWSDGRDAALDVELPQAATVSLTGLIESATLPNRVDVIVNGTQQDSLDITAAGLAPFGPLTFDGAAGGTLLEFVSHNAPVEVDGRSVALDVSNVTVTASTNPEDAPVACLFHP